MSNELSLSLIAGINLKRLIRSSRYRTQEILLMSLERKSEQLVGG